MSTVAIIGAGHNALITACYLAQAGHTVSMYEQAPHTGGLCINQEYWPGYTSSTFANWYGMLCPEVITDLGLTLEPILTDTTWLALTRTGHYVSNFANTLPLTEDDHAALARYEADFAAITRILRTYFLHPAPTKQAFLNDLATLNLPMAPEAMMSASLVEISHHYTTNPHAQMLLQDSFEHPSLAGTGYSHAFMGIPYAHGGTSKWCYLKGGMGVITQQLTTRAETLGVSIHTGTPVRALTHSDTIITGLQLENGQTIQADLFLSGTDYPTTQRLLGQAPARTNAHASTTLPIHLKLKRLPTFTTIKENNLPFPSTLNLLPPFEETTTTNPASPTSTAHIISVSTPTIVDPSRAPTGQHLMMLGIEHAPTAASASGWTDTDKHAFFQHICREISAYSPDFTDCIEDYRILTPQDYATHYGLTSQHCFHGDLTWEFAMDSRLPTLGAGPQTAFTNLFLCGAASHPGGTVNGAPGYRCAQAILHNLPANTST